MDSDCRCRTPAPLVPSSCKISEQKQSSLFCQMAGLITQPPLSTSLPLLDPVCLTLGSPCGCKATIATKPAKPAPLPSWKQASVCVKTVRFFSHSPSSVLLIDSCRDMSPEEKVQLGYPRPAEFQRDIKKATMEVQEQFLLGRQNWWEWEDNNDTLGILRPSRYGSSSASSSSVIAPVRGGFILLS
jgi:hypothetical protein